MTQEHRNAPSQRVHIVRGGALRDRQELFDRERGQHRGVKTEAYHRITNAAVGDGRHR